MILYWLRVLVLLVVFGSVTAATLAATAMYPAALLLVWRDFRNEPWKTATEIWSDAHSREKPFARVYGPEWRAGDPVELSGLPPHVEAGFLAAEDVRFRSHFGIDLLGVARAAVMNLRSGGITQGGSTISQQIVKGRYLENERTWRRKILEAFLAVALESQLTKDEILEAYLNDVYLGHAGGRAVLGIDEAAQVYFDRAPEKLTVAEAALLGAIVRAPNRDNPERNSDTALRRRNAVLDEMHERGWIDEAEHTKARDQRAVFRRGGFPKGEYTSALTALRNEVEREVGRRTVRIGGLRIWCTLDPSAQKNAERAVATERASLVRRHSWIRQTTRKKPLQAALLSIDAKTGAIRALVGAANARDRFDRTRNMRRQPGSAFKPFVYLAAIARREASPATLLLDAPLRVDMPGGKTWEPRNYDGRFRGRVTVREAFEKSLNVPAIRLMEEVGENQVIRVAKRSGFSADFPPVPALPLGVVEVTPRELTAAYSIFPNLGERVEPYLLERVVNGRGRTLYQRKARKRVRVVEPAAAYVTHSLLRGVVRRGTASRLSRYGMAFAAGKTGTTNDYRDAWFVGYTRDVVTTVWVGFDDGTPLRLSSSEAALPMWGSFMGKLDLDRAELDEPDGITWRKIDPETGLLWRAGCAGPRTEVFIEGTQPRRSCPTGWTGRILRRVLGDEAVYDEPPTITVEEFREWAREIDRSRRQLEGALERVRDVLKRIFGD